MEEIIIGIARISTGHQNIERQVRNILEKYPKARIIRITCSGAKVIGYEDFEKVINEAKSGKGNKKYRLVFDSASRMSRDSKGGCDLYEDLFNSNVNIEFLKEPYINTEVYRKALDNQIQIKLNTGDKATDKLMSTIIQALNEYTIELAKDQIKKVFDQAQKELEDLHQRTSEGILTAKLNGKQIGRQEGTTVETKKAKATKEIMKKHSKTFGGSLTDKECMELAKVHRETYYIYKKELKAEMGK